MTLIKYDPFYVTREFESFLQDEPYLLPSRFFGSDFDWSSRFLKSVLDSSPSYWTHYHNLSVNIYETENEWVYLVELPGVKESDIRLECENGYLKLSGERKYDSDEQAKSYHIRELCDGRFGRYFRLHEGSKSDGIKASFKDGILKIEVPKEEQIKSKLIDVKAA